jgi:hypothetical protein
LHGTRNRRPPTGTAAFTAQDFLMGVAEGKAPVPPLAAPGRKRKVMVRKER